MKFYALQITEDFARQEGRAIRGFRDGYDTDSVNSATHIRQYKKIEFDPDLDFVLADDGQANDLLQPPHNIASNCMLMTPRFHEILMSGNLVDHQCFDAVVRARGRLLHYFFVHFYFRFDSDDNNLVDFSRTKFVARELTGPLSILALPTEEKGIEGEFKVNSWKEFHALRDRRENDCWHKIILPSNDKLYVTRREFLDLDVFYVEFRNYDLNNFVVSEKFAALITEAQLTGVSLSPLGFEITPP